MSKDGLVFVGKIIDIQPIPGADFIVSATVICGEGGKWKGIVRKVDYNQDDLCIVFLPDAVIPESEGMAFMISSNWRVKMRRFKGAPSEVVILPYPEHLPEIPIGTDVTFEYKVTKYHKPVPKHLQGIMKGNFPSFIPKTDELNYQRYSNLVDDLVGKPYYITEKVDGSSTTAYRYKGQFGVCSRNLELERNENNGYWQIAIRYKLEENLPEGYAIQWETCGPGIQSNPMGWHEIQGLMFSAYKIDESRYLEYIELLDLSNFLNFPMVMILKDHNYFSSEGIELLGEGMYDNGKPREGVVVRSKKNFDGKPISFKVINLEFDT